MSDNRRVVVGVYHGAFRFARRVFRATRVPSLIILAGVLGVPIVEVMHKMTPAQLALGKYAAECMMIDSFVVSVALFWWILKLFRFLGDQNAPQHLKTF